MGSLRDAVDQLERLADSFQNRNIISSSRRLDGVWQGYNPMYSDSIGFPGPRRQYETNANQIHQHYTDPYNTYLHSSLPVYEPTLTYSPDLRDIPLGYLSNDTTSSPTYMPMEQVYLEQNKSLERISDMLSDLLTKTACLQPECEKSKDQVRPDLRIQKEEDYPHNRLTLAESFKRETGYEFPKGAPYSPLPIPLPDQSSTDDEFILEELPQPIFFSTLDKSEEEDSVDEEIEVERKEETYTKVEPMEYSSTRIIDSGHAQIEMGYSFSHPPVTDYNSHVFLNWSLSDLQNISHTSNFQVSGEGIVTSLETSMETIPPPILCNNIFTRHEEIRSKEGSEMEVLHEFLNQPVSLTIEDERKMAEEFLSLPVEQNFHIFRLSHLIDYGLGVTCFKLLGMYRYFHPPIMDPTDPIKLASK